MKQNSTKILAALIAIILVVGAIMIFVKGFAFELRYQDCQKVEISLGKEFDQSDVRKITDEVFGKEPVRIQAIEVYKDAVSITTTEITEEQKNQLVTKLNEKYEAEIKVEEIEIEDIAHTRGRDILKPYIVPFIVVTFIILGYLMIRYNKLGGLKVLAQSVGIIGLAQIVLFCIMAITRMSIGRFTIPAVLIVYALSTYICTTKFEQDLDKSMLTDNKK